MTAHGPAFYDALLDNASTPYLGPVEASPYLAVYEAVVNLIPYSAAGVVELGCGTGRLARMIRNEGLAYVGLDFAPRLLEEARRYEPGADFRLADLRTDEIPEAEVYVATEVLEHLDADLGLLGRLTKGATVVLSVPSFTSESHVRHFEHRFDAIARYEPVLTIDRAEFLVSRHPPAYYHVLRGVR